MLAGARQIGVLLLSLSCRLSWLIWLVVVVLLAVETGLSARKAHKAVAPATTTAVAPTKAADVEAPAPAPAAASKLVTPTHE